MLKNITTYAGILALSSLPAFAVLIPGASSGGGSGGSLPSMLTVIEPTGSAQTNMPFTMGIPVAQGVLDSSHSIQVNDGATTLNCDENNRASDLSPAIRFVSLTCIVPSATSGEVKQLVPTVVPGAPATGIDITVSDIASAFTASSSYDVPVTFTDINGVPGTSTASLAAALASGKSGWINRSTNTVMGKFRSGGGLVTEYIVFAPAFKSGVADVQLHVVYDVLCYKASRAAVSAGNPILGCKINAMIENGYIQASAPVDNYYGLSVGSGGSVASFANSTPAVTLTLGKTATGLNVPVTASSSLFTANSLGQMIKDGTGVAVINGYTDATHATANIYTAFASTTVGSGTYTLYGIAHPWAERYKFETFFGFAHNPPTVDSGKVYIGAKWSSGAPTSGPGSYLTSTKMLQNYKFSNSSYANDLTNLKQMGANPLSYRSGGAQFGAGGNTGDFQVYLETSGNADAIGVVPDWDVKAIFRYDSNAAAKIFGNANRWATLPIQWRDQKTGLSVNPCNAGTPPNCTGSTNWVMDSRFAGTAIASVPGSVTITPWSQDGFAHDPDGYYVAALMTGDYFWIEGEQMGAANAPMWLNVQQGGIKRVQYVSPLVCCGLQERGALWSFRTVIDAVLLTPDITPSVLGTSKTVANAWARNQTDEPTYGFQAIFVNNTSAGTNQWAALGPHWTSSDFHGFPFYQLGYATFAWAHAKEQGMLTSNGNNVFTWFAQNQVNEVNDSGVDLHYVTHMYWGTLYDVSSSCPGTPATTWTNVYKAISQMWGPSGGATGGGIPRNPSATLTLSATSGSSINATLSGGNYFTTTSFYPGAWVSTTDGGTARIQSVSDANHFVLSTTDSHAYYWNNNACASVPGKAFGSTSYSNSQVLLPIPAPGDPVGTEFAAMLASPGDDYFELTQVGTLYAKENGIRGGAEAYATIYGLNGGRLLALLPYKWGVALRP